MTAGRFEYKKLAKYPHMKPEDIAVWERFIEKNPLFFDRVDYDVPCGKGGTPDPNESENMQRDWTILTQKKIDVVAYKAIWTYVIEVGPVADMRKLGQIVTYSTLYRLDHPDVENMRVAIVCGSVERELTDIFATQGVEILIA